MTWKTIDTAPKDGTWFFAWREPELRIGVHDPLVIVRWCAVDEAWIWPSGPYDVFTSRGLERANAEIECGDYYFTNEFTHWMPIPPLPSE